VETHLAMLDTKAFGSGTRIFYPKRPGDTYMISYVPDQAQGQRTINIDPADGRVIDNIGWQDYSPGGKAIEWGTMLHVGRQYGLANQLANLLVCLTLIGSVVAGLVLWLRRKPKGSLTRTVEKKESRLPAGLRLLLLGLAVVFPLVGASLLLVWLLEKALFRGVSTNT
jgi:uncharacterized iron-regulated membrane protein